MKKKYKIEIKLLSSMHIHSGEAPDGKRMVVKQDNRPFIPATLIKGIVRENFTRIINTFTKDYDIIDGDRIIGMFFGQEGFTKSRTIFDNLYADDVISYDDRTNIAINRATRNVIDGAIVFSETVSPFNINGENIIFTGNIVVYYINEMERFERLFIESLKIIKCIGSGKSRGLGFVEVMISEEDCQLCTG